MVDDLNINVNANLQEFIRKMNSADRMLQRREKRLADLRARIQQTEARLANIRSRTGQIFGSAGQQLGTGALTLALQGAITSSGLETGGFFGRLAIGVGTGAVFGGGLPGAVTAGLTVAVSELINAVGKLGEQQKAITAKLDATVQDVERSILAFDQLQQSTNDSLKALDERLAADVERKTQELLYQTTYAQVFGEK